MPHVDCSVDSEAPLPLHVLRRPPSVSRGIAPRTPCRTLTASLAARAGVTGLKLKPLKTKRNLQKALQCWLPLAIVWPSQGTAEVRASAGVRGCGGGRVRCCAGAQVRWCSDERVRGCASVWVSVRVRVSCGRAIVRACGHAGVRACGRVCGRLQLRLRRRWPPAPARACACACACGCVCVRFAGKFSLKQKLMMDM